MARSKNKAAKKKPAKKSSPSHARKLRSLSQAYEESIKDLKAGNVADQNLPFGKVKHLTIDPTKLDELSKTRIFKVRKGEPLPTELQTLVHEAAQKVAQEILDKQKEQALCSVSNVSPREAYEHCYRYLSMLSMDGQDAVLGRLLQDIETGRQQELDAEVHREQQLSVKTRSLQKHIFSIQSVRNGSFTVLNF